MLDKYIKDQPVAIKIIKNAVSKNKVSHAYLLETNGYIDKEDFAICLAKYLLCPNNYSDNTNCVKCTQCQNIDKNLYEDLKIVKPEDDSLWIKKDQLIELQKDMSTMSVQSGKKVYIITDATKLNASSSNSILKFLEEPSPNIIAILLADNIHQLLDTIVSRCQIISLNPTFKNKKLEEYLSVNVEDIELIKTTAINFLKQFETKHENLIIYTKKLFHNNVVDKNDLIAAFELMMLYYKDALSIKLNGQPLVFGEIDEKVLENSIKELNRRINILLDLKKKIYVNANTNLLIDKLIIELGGMYEDSRN